MVNCHVRSLLDLDSGCGAVSLRGRFHLGDEVFLVSLTVCCLCFGSRFWWFGGSPFLVGRLATAEFGAKGDKKASDHC